MAIFKGFKQVTATQFNAAKDANELVGYLWFVRTEVPETEGENDVTNDSYDIYFGSRKYGHFQAGEIEGIKSSIEALDGNVDGILETLGTLTSAVEKNATDIQSNATNISTIQESLTKFLVKDVNANDKVLNVADGILSSAIDLKYKNNRISLVGKNGVEINGFSAAEFIKDSVLEDVKVDTKEDGEKYIIFTWKTEGETTKTDEIKVSDFAKLYNAGTALELAEDGVTFNVKVAENGNFLSVNDNNELIVDDMTVDKTVLKEAITIEGGPLASEEVKGAFANGVIPAGTDIQAVLKALLCVEIYPVPTKNDPTFTASMSNPSISTTNNVSAGLVEIGQVVKFGTVTAKQVTTTPTNPKVNGFTHGYSSTIDGDINPDTSISVEWDINQKENNVYQLTASKTAGFTNGTLPTSVTAATHSACVLAACELTSDLGTNTYKVEEDGPVFVGTHDAIEAYYIVSNLGGRSEDKKSVTIDANTGKEVNPTNTSNTFTVTGVYPCYTNMVSTTVSNTVAVENRLSLTSGNTFEIQFGPETNAFHAFAFPATHTLSKVEIYNTMSKEYEVYSGGSSTEDTTYTVQGTELDYKVWKRAGSAYTETTKFKFTLNKNLNTK